MPDGNGAGDGRRSWRLEMEMETEIGGALGCKPQSGTVVLTGRSHRAICVADLFRSTR